MTASTMLNKMSAVRDPDVNTPIEASVRPPMPTTVAQGCGKARASTTNPGTHSAAITPKALASASVPAARRK